MLGKLSETYAVTDKVIAQVFHHRIYGRIDLSKISPAMAEKLVSTGHLIRIEKEPSPKPSKKTKKN